MTPLRHQGMVVIGESLQGAGPAPLGTRRASERGHDNGARRVTSAESRAASATRRPNTRCHHSFHITDLPPGDAQ